MWSIDFFNVQNKRLKFPEALERVCVLRLGYIFPEAL